MVCPKGYEMSRLGRLVSVTSCVNYCDFTNDAALLHIIAQTDRLRVDVSTASSSLVIFSPLSPSFSKIKRTAR